MDSVNIKNAIFEEKERIDFTGDKKLSVLVNFGSLAFFFLFYFLFFEVGRLTGNEAFLNGYRFPVKLLNNTSALVFLALIPVLFLLHELIHGAFFIRYTGARPVLGFQGLFAYAGAPEWFVKKQAFLIVCLAPFILISFAGLFLFPVLSKTSASVAFLLITINAAGCIGDLWVAYRLWRMPGNVWVNDSGLLLKTGLLKEKINSP